MTKQVLKKSKLVTRTSGLKKMLFCVVLSCSVYLAMTIFKVEILSRIILGWDFFCLSMISLSWLLFFSTTSKDLCILVEKQDDGLNVIFSIVLVAVCVSVLGTLILLSARSEASGNKVFHTIISLSSVFLSWVLLHTIFTIRYAHLYHDHNKLHTGTNIGGIDFPASTNPDYIDFAYFSFVIGMTFQVSDIVITSPVIRRFVLMHSLISFVFNTIIVALTINTVSNIT